MYSKKIPCDPKDKNYHKCVYKYISKTNTDKVSNNNKNKINVIKPMVNLGCI